MWLAVRVLGILSVAGCGTLIGHVLAYFLEARTMADGHHDEFPMLLELAILSVVLSTIVVVARRMFGRRAGDPMAVPSLPTLCAILALLQVAGFAALEFSEGDAPDLMGCSVEALTALLIAVLVSLFLSFVERCVAPISATYLRRATPSHAAVRRLRAPLVRPTLLLEACAGVRRFKRPPPSIG